MGIGQGALPPDHQEVFASWRGLVLRGAGQVAPLFGGYIATILISLFLLLFGNGVSMEWWAVLFAIVVLHLIPSLLTWRWMEIQKGKNES